MSDINKNTPAFPNLADGTEYDGMTMRDYFAAKALQGALAHDARVSDKGAVARGCYLMADAMLEARNG